MVPKLSREFSGKRWTVSGVNKLYRNWRNARSTIRRQGSGWPHTDDNVHFVNEAILSEEGAPKSHKAIRTILRETGIHHFSVYRIIRKNLKLKCLKKRRVRKHSLLQTVRCAKLAHENCATSFPSIRCGLHIFHWWACVQANGRHFEHLIWSYFSVACVHFELSDEL